MEGLPGARPCGGAGGVRSPRGTARSAALARLTSKPPSSQSDSREESGRTQPPSVVVFVTGDVTHEHVLTNMSSTCDTRLRLRLWVFG